MVRLVEGTMHREAEAWRLGAPGIAIGFAAAGAGIAYATINAILN
jgi:hypothetical protein